MENRKKWIRMYNLIWGIIIVAALQQTHAQPATQHIRKVLQQQTNAWNRGDIPGFMQGYWHSDSLLFIGKSGITYGWQPTLENYQKNYADTANMGQLQFTIVQIKALSSQCYFVLGKWFLKRSVGDVGGHFTLIFKKMKGGWKIISDHSS